MQAVNPRRGYILGLTAYICWGLFPLYFKAIGNIPSVEIIVQRVLWSALFASAVLLFWKHPNWWRDLRDNPKRLAVLALSGSLIAVNWLVYIWAVNNGRMLEASLGYYINPLVNVLLGMLILRERLRPLQWAAVALAAIGVAQQVWQVGSLPWISLTLALTFAFYGLIRKQAPVAALPGLAVETWLLVPIALGWLLLHPGVSTAAGPVADRRRAVHLDSPGQLQRRGAAPAVRHSGLPAVHRPDPGAEPGGAGVRRTAGAGHPRDLRLHLDRVGRLQRGCLAVPAAARARLRVCRGSTGRIASGARSNRAHP
jgi:chloramphenicol-sensitive protein RarD